MPPHLPQNVSYMLSSTILQSSRARKFCNCAALVLTQASFRKVRQVGMSANCLGDGGSFRLVNSHTNWRQERATRLVQKEVVVGSHFSTSYLTEMNGIFGVKMHQSNPMLRVDSFEPFLLNIYIYIYLYIVLQYKYIYILNIYLDLRKNTNNCPFARFLPLGWISCEGAGNDYCGQFWILYLSGWSYSTLRKNVSVFLGGNSREKVVNTREKCGNTRANSSWL